jgi:hypothetical protein
VRLLGVLVPVACALAACGGAETENRPLVTGSFVAAIPHTRLYVAVVAAEPADGRAERPLRVYVCDHKTVNEWFPGSGGNDFELSSESGKWRVRATLEPGAATGTIERPEGGSLRFRAEPATGIAGLYENRLFPDGRIRGSTETGARLEGRLSDEPDASGRFRATGIYIGTDGERVPYVTFRHGRLPKDQVIESRVVVLADGSREGGFKKHAIALFANNQPP